MFNKLWFLKYQKLLLKFANSFIGRYILCISGKKSSVGKNKIIRILPNSITWNGKKKNEFVTEFRTHDKFAKRIYYAFKPIWYLLHLWDMAWYPNFNLGFDSLGPLYPDAPPESTTVDDMIQNGNASFAACRAASEGTLGADGQVSANFNCTLDTGNYYIGRYFHLFDTSDLPDTSIISIAVYSVYDAGEANWGNANTMTVHAVATTPASNTDIVLGDFDQVGSTSFGSKTLADWDFDVYNDLSLNATGIVAISKTSITKFGMRMSGDIDGSPTPTGINRVTTYMADQTGTNKDPKLVITYTLPGGGIFFVTN